MTSLQKATLDEIREAAARLCRDYLTGAWKVVKPDELIVKRISGGLSNFLYYISLPDEHAGVETDAAANNSTTANAAEYALILSNDDDDDINSNNAGKLESVNLTKDFNANKRLRTNSGGISNSRLFDISNNNNQKATEPHEVLLRIYGQSHGEDALEAMIAESVVFALLSERNFGPKLHGIFPGGRIEQYIPARPLLTTELAVHRISMKIAEKMGEIHSLNIPMSKEPDWLWNCMERWLNSIESILARSDWKDNVLELLYFVRSFDFREEAKWLKSVIEHGNYKVLFCHNDLQEGNILFRENADAQTYQSLRESLSSLRSNLEDSSSAGLDDSSSCNADNATRKRPLQSAANDTNENNANDFACSIISSLDAEPDLIIIDFEYCAYNYRGFDLANHFLEWTFDYSNPEFPHYYHHKHQYPTKQQRCDFVFSYLKHLNGNVCDGMAGAEYIPSADELESVEKEIQVFSMFSHLFWSLWSVVNVTSNIEFGYWEYAVTRIREYQKLKANYIRHYGDIFKN